MIKQVDPNEAMVNFLLALMQRAGGAIVIGEAELATVAELNLCPTLVVNPEGGFTLRALTADELAQSEAEIGNSHAERTVNGG